MAASTIFHIQSSPQTMNQLHDQHHPTGLQAPTSTPGSMDHSTNNHQTLQNGGGHTLHPTTRWILAPGWPRYTSTANKVNPDSLWRGGGGRHTEIPSEHRIVNVQHRGTILVAEHNNLPEVETPQNINEEAQIIWPRIHQYTYAAFEAFVQKNMQMTRCNNIPSNGYSRISHQR